MDDSVNLTLLVNDNVPDRVLGNDIKGMEYTWDVPKDAKCNVDEQFWRAETTFDDHRERWEDKCNEHKETVAAAHRWNGSFCFYTAKGVRWRRSETLSAFYTENLCAAGMRR